MLKIFALGIIVIGIGIVFKAFKKNSKTKLTKGESSNSSFEVPYKIEPPIFIEKPSFEELSKYASEAPYKIEPVAITEKPAPSNEIINYAERIEKRPSSKKTSSKKKPTKKNKG